MAEDLNLKTVETVDTRPFRKLVMTIGELPTSFVESMTYYELLAWFTNYLETVIIPTVNNNGEAVTELQGKFVELNEAFTTLKNFVDNYFDNLDVQEEINNKLDEMAKDGTLQEIITTYIQSNVAWTFDTVADMKLATNLVDGSFAQTLGFYTRNDKGGALYKITNTGTANEMDVIALSGSLYAHLIPQMTMNVKQFGAKGDGTTDDTTFIQKAIDTCDNITIPAGTYMINAVTHINMNTGNRLSLDQKATLKAITNAEESYAIIWLEDVTNAEICGGTLEGDRLTHTGATGEWGHCIRLIGDCDKIYIHDITLKNSWGDGITCKITGSVSTERVHVDNARRNGYSIAAAFNFTSSNDIIENVNGTNPQSGIDIEPDNPTELLHNIVIENLLTKNNTHVGLKMHLLQDTTEPVNIRITNHHDIGSQNGLMIAKSANLKGSIVISNSYLESNTDAAIRFERCYDGDCLVRVIRPQIFECNKNNVGNLYGADITGIVTSSQDNLTMGNIEIYEPYLSNSQPTTRAISFSHQGNVSPAVNNVKIINPMNVNERAIYISSVTNLTFSDLFNTSHLTTASSFTLVANQYYSLYTNATTSTSSLTFTIPDGLSVGRRLKFRNISSTAGLRIKLPTTDYCPQLSTSISPRLVLAKYGDTIELEKYDATNWIVIDNPNNSIEG